MRSFYETTITRLESLVAQFEAAKILHDHDNYQDSLDDYAFAQYKFGAGAPGAEGKVADLKQFFPRSGTSAPPTA